MSPIKEQTQKSIELEQQFDEFTTKLYMRVEFFEALKSYRDNSKKIGEWDRLANEERRYVDKVIHGMERSGLDKPLEERQEIEKLTN